ncbi:MAG: acyltransferase [Isosphaeraceae bacterium]|nr:acyltransferase [Isosphaeraceae bacterium]
MDALRGLACLVILLYHLKPRAMPFGWMAVDLFFVLSGYLITVIILRHQGVGGFLRTFYLRRGLRTWPIYYLTIGAIVALSPVLPRPCQWSGLLQYLTYTQNTPLYWSAQAPRLSPYLDHLWTLAIEEQFYLIWPALIGLVGRRGVVPLALAVIALSAGARARGYDLWLLLTRGDGLALGGLLAVILGGRGQAEASVAVVRPRVGFVVVGLLALGYLGWSALRGDLPTFGRPKVGAEWSILAVGLLCFAVVGLVVSLEGSPALEVLRRRRLCAIGMISYGLYLYHYVVITLGNDIAEALGFRGRPLWRDLIWVGLSFALAALSWRYIERPILTYKERFHYRPPVPESCPQRVG